MPELPEVETVCRGLAMHMEGRRVRRLDLNRPDLRIPLPPGLRRNIEGKTVERIARRAKYILIHFEQGGVLLVHLGMAGRIVVTAPGAPAPPLDRHDHVVFAMADGAVIRFNDARRFGLMDWTSSEALDRHKLLAGLGPEPLGNGFNGPALAAALAGKMTSIKAALLDQRVVAGLGNIYASESLFWAGISPRRIAASIAGARAERLVGAVRDVLSRAIAAGGSSLRDYVQASGELGYFQHHWAVYGREGERCPDCDCKAGIKRIVQAGRSTFYCAKRQR
ncbi:MAG: bifunctional DNA-formamidopyrimidine glycosylase/DNA-(apurinic or apyrimidinic site) lyase [Alphaproteobacteria bacterium]|nr:bifunctional DNA-formamidopyrimidine glycosylase/DNA-(apurinic or apyrimidinic site) lyase [Alphaproteobacteria bacterium]